MSWFGKKSSSDTKARIEELKKKIQAEQTAYSQTVVAPPPPAPPPARVEDLTQYAPPVAAPAPIPVAAALVSAPMPLPNVYVVPSEPQPPRPTAPTEYAPREYARAHHQAVRHDNRHEVRHEPRQERQSVAERPVAADRSTPDVWRDTRPREQPKHHVEQDASGVVLDLGDGLSLNLPIRARMQLDEFLVVAQRVRELQRLDRHH